MIEVHLTGATEPDELQNLPQLSLGGYPSEALAPSNAMDYIFGGVSEMNKFRESDDYICLAIKNAGEDIVNATISLESPAEPYSSLVLAVVEPTMDVDGKPYFERIANPTSAPIYAEFDDANEGFSIPSIPAGTWLGIWIRRSVSPAARLPKDLERLIYEFEHPNEPVPPDVFSIKIDYA